MSEAIFSLLFAIFGIFFSLFFPILNYIFGYILLILAMICGIDVLGKKESKDKLIASLGIILGFLGLCYSFISNFLQY